MAAGAVKRGSSLLKRQLVDRALLCCAVLVRTRRTNELSIICRASDDGCSSKMTTLQAGTMKRV